jgi:hypothetical protein
MSKDSNSHQRFAFPVLLYDERQTFAELPSEIHIVPCDDWERAVYGRMIITSSDITEFRRNFDAGVRKDILPDRLQGPPARVLPTPSPMRSGGRHRSQGKGIKSWTH